MLSAQQHCSINGIIFETSLKMFFRAIISQKTYYLENRTENIYGQTW